METCIICGEPIPEGRQVCYSCEHKINEAEEGGKTDESKKINAW